MSGQNMEREIRSQPEILQSNAQRYFEEAKRAIDGRTFEIIVIAARGSSDHAALYARYLFEIHLQIPVVLAAPSVLTKYGVHVRYPSCLAIGISQSGAAPDVAEVLEALRSEGHRTLAITNTADSRITKAAEVSLLLGCGEEKSVAATKTYTASLLTMYQLARAIGADLPEPVSFLPSDVWTKTTEMNAQSHSGAVLRSHTLFALARGYRFCSAFETALKLMECALIPCKSYSTADFEHGPKALAGHGSAAIIFGGNVPSLKNQGCLELLAPNPELTLPEPLLPIWDIFFGQWLALSSARSRGLDPDDPQFIQKITETL